MITMLIGPAVIGAVVLSGIFLAFAQERADERRTPRPAAPSAAHPGVLAAQKRAHLRKGRPVDGDALSAAESRVLAEVEWDSQWIRVPEPRHEGDRRG